MASKKLKVAVLMGGPSSEHEVSLATGRKIIQALDPDKYLAQPVTITRERQWLMLPGDFPQQLPSGSVSSAVTPRTNHSLIRANRRIGAAAGKEGAGNAPTTLVPFDETMALEFLRSGGMTDVVFIAMHGEFGEDGTIQGLLEAHGIPYTGSGVLASALGMDKPRSLSVFRDVGLTIPDFFVVSRDEWEQNEDRILGRARSAFGFPVVIKPANRGSSVGVTIARTGRETQTGLMSAFSSADEVMIQRHIAGTELTCGVLETPEGTYALQPTQIIPKGRAFFDYHAKYTPGAAEEITPPRLPAENIRKIQETALVTHHAIGARGMSRTDMIFADDGKLNILEINTIPGMTETSLLPQAAAAVGIPFPKLLGLVIAAALKKNPNLPELPPPLTID